MMYGHFGSSAKLPKKREKKRMQVREVEKKEFPRHRRFVRKFACVVPYCPIGPIEFCHVRSGLPIGEQAGMAEKPHDCFGCPGCPIHHAEQHRIGEPAFERKYGVNLLATAINLSRVSPCPEIRAKAKSITSI